MFNCNKCGACCMSLSSFSNEFDRGDGVCRYFDLNTHLCTIYYERPLICRVDEFYDRFISEKMTREEYYKINYETCKELYKNKKKSKKFAN